MELTWAMAQLRNLLPLDDESLQQILSYAGTLSNEAAADHFKNLLGDGPQALEFISSYNSRRKPNVASAQTAASSSSRNDIIPPVPKANTRKTPKKSNFNKLPPPRQVEGYGDTSGAYMKRNEEDYMGTKPVIVPSQSSSAQPKQTQAKLPPSATGKLISDITAVPKRAVSPAKTVKVSITGGTPMKGKSTALTDLEVVIRNLEIQTNPTLALTAEENAKRKCNCMATKHDLLTAAPNCLKCGKIICVKEGVGPCTFCGNPLLTSEEIQGMIRVLKDENGREKQEANNAAHRRPEVSKTPRPFSANNDKLDAATQQRDRLLAFQAENAKRTRIHDEASDFDYPSAGTNIWDTPMSRAMELKKQQKALREQEWRNRPEWEKKKMVASIEVGSGKGRVVKQMIAMEAPPDMSDSEPEDHFDLPGEHEKSVKQSFSKNPLLAGLVRPVAKLQSKGKGRAEEDKQSGWRRVQDESEDNERWILDGGIKGVQIDAIGEEPPCG